MLQIIVGLVLALFFITLYSMHPPYLHGNISTLKSLTQWQIYVVYFIALLIRTDKLDSTSYRSAIQVFLIFAVFANFIFDVGLFAVTRFGEPIVVVENNKLVSDMEVNEVVLSPLADETGVDGATSRVSTTEMVGR